MSAYLYQVYTAGACGGGCFGLPGPMRKARAVLKTVHDRDWPMPVEVVRISVLVGVGKRYQRWRGSRWKDEPIAGKPSPRDLQRWKL